MSRLASRVRPPLASVRLASSRRCPRRLLRAGAAVLVLCLATALVGTAASAADDGDKRIPRVRPADRVTRQLLEEGCRRSPTLRRLVEQIDHSDLIVYLESTTEVPRLTQAYLQLAGSTPAARFVRIAIKIPGRTDALISQVGHELEHATEIARVTDVRDQASMEALYRRIGDQNEAGWDTAAARLAGKTVLEELGNTERVLKADTRPADPAHASSTPAVGPPK